MNACSVLSHHPYSLGPGFGPHSEGHFCFGSRTTPDILKGNKGGKVALPPCWFLSFPFPLGPNPGKDPLHKPESNNKFTSLFLSLQEARCQCLWGNWSFLPPRWQVGAVLLCITLCKVSIHKLPEAWPHPSSLIPIPPSKKIFRCFLQIRERRRGLFLESSTPLHSQ